MKVKDNNPLRNKINLFIKTINDLQNYRIDPEEKENIFSIPENMKNVLREIISSQEISEFIINISNEKLEKIKENNQKSKMKITKEVKEEEPNNLFNYKKYQNISCFGQNSILNLNQFYHSVNEAYDLMDNILNYIFIIDKEAFYSFIDILKNNIQKEQSFLFINPDNCLKPIYKKKKNYSKTFGDNYKDLINESEKKFTTIDNYYKFVKKEKKEIEENKNNENNQQFDIFFHEMNKRKKSVKSQKKIKYPLLFSPLNSSKDLKQYNNTFIMKKSYENLCKLPNVGILNVIYRNKNIKDEIYNSKVKRGLIKNKNKVYLSDYDYNNILDIKNPIIKTKKNYLNSIFNKFYNSEIYKKK